VAERFNLAWWQAPFLITLVALSYDLAMDAVAIRLGFWSWRIPLNQEWFGVPYDNFFGWLAVVWIFALSVNFSYQDFVKEKYRKIIRYAAPITSALLLGMAIMIYVNLSAVLSGRFSWGEAKAFYDRREYDYAYLPEVQRAKGLLLLFIVLSVSALCFAWMKKAKAVSAPQDGFSIRASLAIHSMFFLFLVSSGIYESQPIFIAISFFACAFSLFLESVPRK
jgi:hypothetical protein